MILVAGSANLDFVVRSPHIPQPGETVLGRSYRNFPGGKGANQAVACAKAGGAPTRFVGAFGQDALATPIQQSLREAGVQLDAVTDAELPTGTAFICVADNGENAITVVPGANAALQAAHLPPLDGVSHLLLQLETPIATLRGFAQAARGHGVTVVLNAAPASRDCLPLLPWVDILIVNEGELALLSGVNGSISAQMQALAVPTLVVTLGARGCVARADGHWLAQTAFGVPVVDTTAAGDTFCGALVATLAGGASLKQALGTASAAAALACTQPGAQTSIPTQAAVAQFLSNAPTTDAAAHQALLDACGATALSR